MMDASWWITSGRPPRPYSLLLLCCALLLASTTAATAAASSHTLTGRDFTIVDADTPQRYRLLGSLPYTQTLWEQALTLPLLLIVATAACLLVLVIVDIVSVHFLLPRAISSPLLVYLPDPLARLVSVLHTEAIACAEVVMTMVAAPVGLGRDLASLLVLPNRRQGKAESNSSEDYTGKRTRRETKRDNEEAKAVADSSRGQYPGIYNTGNSCFLNSTLQSLASLDRLSQHLVAVESLAEEWDVPTPVTDGLHDVIRQLNQRSTTRRAIMPSPLTDALSSSSAKSGRSLLQAHQQQDAHELLVVVSSALDEEREAVLAEREEALRNLTVGLGAAAIGPSFSSPALLLKEGEGSPFRGLVAQRTACMDCGYVEAVRHYATDELSLAVPARYGAVTHLESCLAHWAKLERIDWICHRCSLIATLARCEAEVARLGLVAEGASGTSQEGEQMNKKKKMQKQKQKQRRLWRDAQERGERIRRALQLGLTEDDVEQSGLLADIRLERVLSQRATKHVMLARPPPVLVIHLNRSSYSAGAFGASKNNAQVIFDEWLDVGAVTTAGELDIRADQPISRATSPAPEVRLSSSSQTLYRLCAVVVHYGGHSSGHYVCFRRRKRRSDPGALDDDFSLKQNDEWSRISDSDVQPCHANDVLRQNPFLLFYERVFDPRVSASSQHQPSSNGFHTLTNGHANGNGHAIANGNEAKASVFMKRAITPRVVHRWATSAHDLANGRAQIPQTQTQTQEEEEKYD